MIHTYQIQAMITWAQEEPGHEPVSNEVSSAIGELFQSGKLQELGALQAESNQVTVKLITEDQP